MKYASFKLAGLGCLFAAALTSCGSKEETKTTQTTGEKKAAKVEAEQLTPPASKVANDVVKSTAPAAQKPAVGRYKPAPIPVMDNSKQPFVLEDVSQVKVAPGEDSPKVGDMIYTYSTIPTKACGEYWVQDDNGNVMKLSICTDDHDHDHDHDHEGAADVQTEIIPGL